MLFLFLCFFISVFLAPVNVSAQHVAEPVRLVVVINIEQMRADYLQRFASRFRENGFLRLAGGGAVCSDTRINQHVLKNLTGVPTLFSGVYPARHGIVDESWYDRLKEKEIDALKDNDCLTLGSDSREGQRSPALLLSATLGDVLKLCSRGKSKVFSVALNDYSAVFSAGHAADGAYWMDNQTGNMISSSFYVDRFPGWALNFNNKKMAGYFSRQEWTTLLLPSSYKESLPDDYPLEKGYFGKWRQFPYRLSQLFNQTGNYKVLKTTPYGNAVVNEFAMALIGSEKLGRDEVPDLLALSFSSMDYENGSFGPLSVEMEDTYLRLDKEIGMLLDFLDKQVGENRYLVVLTSACSSSYPVGYLKEAFNMPVGYVAPESMVALLKSFLNISYGQGDWVVFSSGHQIYLNRPLIEKKGIRLDDIQSRAAGFINQFEGVRLSVPAFDFIRVDHVKSQLAMISGSYNLKRSGDVLYTLEEGWQPRYRYRKPDYTDQMRIPLIWYGPRIKPGKSRVPAEAVDMAPTVFELLGIEPPFSFDGRILVEILAD